MFNKKVILVALGYVFGSTVSSLYNKKKPADLKKDLKKSRKEGEGDIKVLLQNFFETQKTFFQDLQSSLLSEKNKKILHAKKKDILKVVEEYKKDANGLLSEIKVKGKDFIGDASETLESLYKEKLSEIKEFAKVAPDKAQELKDSLTDVFNDFKKKMK